MREYKNFDVELLDHARVDGRETLRSRVTASPAGGETDAEALPVELPAGLREGLERLERRELDADGLIELGTKLGLLLLPVRARGRYRESLAGLREDEGLRLRIRADAPELAALPWEFACVVPPGQPPGPPGPECLLGLNRRLSLVRHEGRLPVASLRRLAREEIRVAALLADVEDPAYPRLDLAREELNLRRALHGVARVEADFLRPGTLEQLEAALDKGAQVLHFAGHGDWQARMGEKPGSIEGTGRLILATEERKPQPQDVGQLAASLRARGVRLAVLAACEGARRDAVNPWTGIAPALLREGLPAVVGMQYSVRDGDAIAFSKRLYDQLAAGLSIDTAVAEARIAVFTRQGAAERDWGAPVLYLRSEHNLLFPPAPGPLRRNLALLGLDLALLGTWFYLHLYPLFGALLSRWTLALGGSGVAAGLLAVFRLAWSLLRPRADSERTPPLDRLLRRKGATWLLGPLLVLSLLLLGLSGSFWLTLEEGSGDDPVVVRFSPSEGLPFAPKGELRVSRGSPVAGGPFLFPIRGQVAASVEAPAGWELTPPFQPRLWLPVQLRFPSSFRKLELRVLMLVTGLGLPWPDQHDPQPGRTFRLEVTTGTGTFAVADLREGLVFLGAPGEVLERRAAQESEDDLNRSLGSCILDDSHRDEWLRGWREGRRAWLATPVLAEGDSLELRVINNRNGRACFEETVPASSLDPGKITPHCLVRQRQDCLDD